MRPTAIAKSAIALTTSIACAAHATTFDVPGDYPTIQAAINAASDGDEIVVAPGTYGGSGNTNLKTQGKKITVRSATGAEGCAIVGFAYEFWNGDSADTIIDGFTFRNATGLLGGAMSIWNSSPTIRNCIFTDCKAISNGGAVSVIGPGSQPLFEHCVFADNVAPDFGGGLSLVSGAQVTVRECDFSANRSANGYGGGVYVGPTASAIIERCMFTGNSVSGVYIETSPSDPVTTVVDCLFSGNTPGNFGVGGGVHSLVTTTTIINCTFTANVGSAVGKRGTVANSILADSVSSTGVPLLGQVLGNVADFTITFSNVENGWTGPGSNNLDGDPNFTQVASGTWTLAPAYDALLNRTVYTDSNATFEPGALVGLVMNPDTAQQRRLVVAANTATTISVHGNLTLDAGSTSNLPVEINDAYAIVDARPIAGSPTIDAGSNGAVPASVVLDLDGFARFVDDPDAIDTGVGRGPIVDMGAFERQVSSGADLNGDGAVNPLDLGILLGAWGSTDPDADLDHDGLVGPADLSLLLGAWTG